MHYNSMETCDAVADRLIMTTNKSPSFKELNILRDNYKELASSLTSNEGCRRILLDKLYSQEIITEEQHISISNKERFHGAHQSTTDLLQEVIQFVRNSPNRFIEVLEIMEKEVVLRNIVKSMKFQLNTVPHIMKYGNGKRPLITPKPNRTQSVGVLPNVTPQQSRPRTQSTRALHILEQFDDITAKAQSLKSQFNSLIVSVKNSPKSNPTRIADLKRHIQVFLGSTFTISSDLQEHIDNLELMETIEEILDYLQKHNFLGYFNCCLLEEAASLLEDRFVSQEVEKYKDMHTSFLMESTFSRVHQLFEENSDLVPTIAAEFPAVVFEVNTLSWSDKAIFSCIIHFDNKFSWVHASALKVEKQERFRLVYAVPPRVYNEAAKALRNPSVLEELTTMQITVADVPDITFCEAVSNMIIIMPPQLHTCAIHRKSPHHSYQIHMLHQKMWNHYQMVCT